MDAINKSVFENKKNMQNKKVTEWYLDAVWGKIALVSWGDATKKPVLLVHGYMDSAATFSFLVEHLPDTYYYVAFDLPGLLFSKKSSPRIETSVQLETINSQMLGYVDNRASFVLGTNFGEVLTDIVCAVQNPARNKQLVYQLLDICLLELFPELNENTSKPTER